MTCLLKSYLILFPNDKKEWDRLTKDLILTTWPNQEFSWIPLEEFNLIFNLYKPMLKK